MCAGCFLIVLNHFLPLPSSFLFSSNFDELEAKSTCKVFRAPSLFHLIFFGIELSFYRDRSGVGKGRRDAGRSRGLTPPQIRRKFLLLLFFQNVLEFLRMCQQLEKMYNIFEIIWFRKVSISFKRWIHLRLQGNCS